MASDAFATIKRAVLWAARSVPVGHVVSAADLGKALNLPARHVSHILSRLSDDERMFVAVHRVVPRPSGFPAIAKRTERHQAAIAQLKAEGISVLASGKISGFEQHSVDIDQRYANTVWADEPDWQPTPQETLFKE